MVSVDGVRTKGIEAHTFSQEDCRRIIGEAWGRYTGQPITGQTGNNNSRAPGFFGLTASRRWHLFKLPEADPTLPVEMGEYPHYQSDLLRQKHWEMVSRLCENQFRIEATGADDSEASRKLADKAEWVLSYGAQSIQERTGVDWQTALAEGVDAYGQGCLHWRIAPELTAKTPDQQYRDDLPADGAKDYGPTAESVGGDVSKGKYRETAAAAANRAALAKARAPFPIHVEVVAADQVAFIEDESYRPGPGLAVHVKEVGIIDYNGELQKAGLRLVSESSGQSIKLSMQEFDPATQVAMERPAPVGGQLPSVAGWKQRIAVAYVWSRDECYELASASLQTGASDSIINATDWLLVKSYPHGYGRVPFTRAFASVEYNEWDPAIRYQPALAGLYATKPQYDYSRALEMRMATQKGIQEYFLSQDKDAPPALEGDEEGDQLLLTRDSAQAQLYPPGVKLEVVPTPDLNPAFVRDRELQAEEMAKSAPPTGHAAIEANTKPWTARLGQSQENAYPAQLMLSIVQALAVMFRNWTDVAAKSVQDGGLGVGLYVPTQRVDKQGKPVKGKVNMAQAVGMEPKDWEGIWVDVEIDPVSAAERISQTQLGLEILNNPVHITTPEQFVSDDMGVQDATGWMQRVDSYWAVQPTIQGLITQEVAKHYGSRFIVGADGVIVGPDGKAVDPNAVNASNGIHALPSPAPLAGMDGSPEMPGLPDLAVNGAAPAPGIPAAGAV